MADDRQVGDSGYSFEDVSAYVDRGRTPRIAAIEDDAECQAIIDRLETLSRLSTELVSEGAREAGAVDAGWMDRLLAEVGRELRAGKDLPYAGSDEVNSLTITEGAVREVARSAADAVPGVLAGRCRLEVIDSDSARVSIGISVIPSRPLRAIADEVRGAVTAALQRQTPFGDVVVDVTIEDVVEATEDGR